MFSFLSPYLTAIYVVAGVLFVGGDFYAGYHYRALGEEAAIAKAEQQAIAEQQARDQISLDSAVADAKAQQHIVVQTQTIVKRIPVYVQKTDRCPLSNGYVRVWDNGITGSDQGNSSAQSNATPSGLDTIAALNNAVENFGVCHAIAQQLIDLQSWGTQQENVK